LEGGVEISKEETGGLKGTWYDSKDGITKWVPLISQFLHSFF